MEAPHPVALLPPEVSRRIAAGEVIERPASVVRELIDNSLDAGSSTIDISWEAGGSELIRVTDDGRGMSRDDLHLCWQPHATSKIRSLEDLDRTTSLGFRGEALSSVAAVSELEIRSAVADAAAGNRLLVRRARLVETTAAPPTPGTTIEVRRLFANLPARRRFLSRSQAETAATRNVIMDKALPFPDVRFTHHAGTGRPRVLPAQTAVERAAAVFGSAAPAAALHEVSGSGEGFSLSVIAAEPAIVRRDRRLIQVFVNRRRVWEYKLVQAVEYAYQDVQHGGLFPVAAVMVEIDPALIDVNIHPAKREVRLRNGGEIHHRLVELLRSFLRAWTVKGVSPNAELWPAAAGEAPGVDRTTSEATSTKGDAFGRGVPRHGTPPWSPTGRPPSAFREDARSTTEGVRATTYGRSTGQSSVHRSRDDQMPAHRPPPRRTQAHFDHETRALPSADQLVYRGSLFGMFIIVERGDRAWIIDQHAAHERLLYDRFAAARTSQNLLVPDEFEVTDDQDAALQRHREEYGTIGIVLERSAPRRWLLSAMPAEYRENSEDLIETILEVGGLHEALDRKFVAEMACKAALKAGDYLDDITALQLAERTLRLPEPRCPHGRPLYVELTQDGLERMIGRR